MSNNITNVIGTNCLNTDSAGLLNILEQKISCKDTVIAVDFTNVHIVTARKVEEDFQHMTEHNDYFVPDSQVLKWVVNLFGGSMTDRVYGPDFLNFTIKNSAESTTHYFLGASQVCLDKLITNCKIWRPNLKVRGSHNGYFTDEENQAIIDDINRCKADFIWVGLGTPKRQEWIFKNRHKIHRGVLLAVGFAFDVNAGTKSDAPQWMQPLGLTWLHRLVCEPKRLWWRYLKYNTIFLYFVLVQKLRQKKCK